MSDLIASATRVPGLELELRTDTQYAHAYLGERPFATIRRRHACDPRTEAPWRVWLGQDPRARRCYSAEGVVRFVERAAMATLAKRVQS